MEPGSKEKIADFQAQSLKALSRWVFHDDTSSLTPEMLTALRLSHLAPAFFPELLTQSEQERKRFLSLQGLNLKQKYALQKIAALFAGNGIDFCPFKGADLSWRVWPESPFFRKQSDLDILISDTDRQKACALLQENGWKLPFQYASEHHEPQLVKNNIRLEVHFKLPHFEDIDEKTLWRELIPAGTHEFRLPEEMNFLMLFQHARGHKWIAIPHLLLDSGFLIRHEGMPDMEKMNSLARRFRISTPELLFAAFPDFFPAGTIPGKNFPPDIVESFRRLVFSPGIRKDQHAASILSESGRFSGAWWRKRWSALHPSVIRLHTNNPHGAYGKLCIGYIRVCSGRLAALFRHLFGKRDETLQKHLCDLEKIEKFLQ